MPSNLDPSLLGAAGDKAPPFVDGCDDSYTDTTVRRCQFGDTESKTTIVLFGDSHAAQWFPALDAIANQRGWRLVTLTKATCPPVEISIYSPVLGRQFHECDQWRAAALARIRAEKPLLVVTGAARHYGPEYHFQVYGEQWISGLAKMVQELRAITPHVFVFGPTPKPNQDIPSCLSQHLTDVGACVQSRSGSLDSSGSTRGAQGRHGGGRQLPRRRAMALHEIAVPRSGRRPPRLSRRQSPHDDDHHLARAPCRGRARRRPARSRLNTRGPS